MKFLLGIVCCLVPPTAIGRTTPPDRRARVTAVALVYSKRYEINLAGLERAHPFDIHKYEKIAGRLLQDGVVTRRDFHQPDELTREQLLLVHTPDFLKGLEDPQNVATYLEAPIVGMLPPPLVEQGMLKSFRCASGGTILACRLALKHGIAVNIGGGYHHAKPDRGEGFCIYADMPIAIRLLQREKAVGRVLVVDLDVHQGNGTIVCCRNDDSVFTFSMHQRDIYPIPKEKGDLDVELPGGTTDKTYLETLGRHLPGLFDRSRPDLVIFQAGCDPLAEDPLANLSLTKAGIVERDAYVIDACVRRGVPVAMVLGGGYSKGAWAVQYASIRRILQTHRVLRREPDPPAKPGPKNPG